MKHPLVLALNPSMDADWRVDTVRWEEKNNVLGERRWAGGKGVNVARWLQHLGANPRLLLPLGGSSGAELATALRAERLPARVVPIRGTTRTNVIISTRVQGQLRFNPLGPELSAVEWRRLERVLTVALRRASLLILSGSLPRGVAVTTYARLIRQARRACVPVVLDCDGPALRAAVPAGPLLVKPNEHELGEWARAEGLGAGRSGAALLRFATEMSKRTRGWVLVSRGARPAWLVNARQNLRLQATPPPVRPLHTLGAGDALLAAAVQALLDRRSPAEMLEAALAIGSLATRLPAGTLPRHTPSPKRFARRAASLRRATE